MSAKMASRKEPKIIPYSFEAIFLSDVIWFQTTQYKSQEQVSARKGSSNVGLFSDCIYEPKVAKLTVATNWSWSLSNR